MHYRFDSKFILKNKAVFELIKTKLRKMNNIISFVKQ